jgi:competence protein ComEC
MHRTFAEVSTNRPAVLIGLALVLGIGLAQVCRNYTFWDFAAADIALISASFLALRGNRLSLGLGLVLTALSLNGLLLALTHRDGYSSQDLRSLVSRKNLPLDRPVSFEGCIAEETEIRGQESVTTVALHGILQKDRWVACEGKAILRVAQSEEPAPQLMPGDRVRGWAVWHTPRNYLNPGSADSAGLLARRGIFLIGRAKSPKLLETIPGDCSYPWTKLVNRVRARVRAALDPIRAARDRQTAAILASLIIGDYSGLSNETRETFQNSGTFHVLVVSGLHVAWLAGMLLYFFKIIYMPEKVRYLLVATIILGFTLVVGFQASITRCLWMFCFYLLGRIIFRRVDAVNILFASAVLLLALQPDWLFEIGFQLSFLSVIAIASTSLPVIDRHIKPLWEPMRYAGTARLFLQSGTWHYWGRTIRTHCELIIESVADRFSAVTGSIFLRGCRILAGAGLTLSSMAVVSLSVQLWLEPVLALYFNRMSWISPVANLIIVPFSSLVLASGFIVALTAGIPLLGPAAAQISGCMASLLLFWASRIAAIPGAWQRCPTPGAIWIWTGIVSLLGWTLFQWRKAWIPGIYVVSMLAFLSWGSMPALGFLIKELKFIARDKQDIWEERAFPLTITFLDVGEGDSIIICFPDGRWWVLDAGGLRQTFPRSEDSYSFDIGEAVVSRYLWQFWVTRLDRLLLSHADSDHSGGIPAVLGNFQIGRFECAKTGLDAMLSEIRDTATRKNVPIRYLHAGMREDVDGVTIRVLNPPRDTPGGSTNENSLVLEVSYKRFSALLTGDLEKGGESMLLAAQRRMGALLLKVAHHGSRSGTSEYFLNRVQPRWAVISVGRNNPFGHPSRDVLARLLRHGVQPYLTLDQGAVTFGTDGVQYGIKSFVSGLLETGMLKVQP